jgi:ribonuclease D
VLVERLRTPGEIALDTEGDSLHHYPERLALVQLAVPGGSAWLVDPLALSLEPLAGVTGAVGVCVLLHAGDNDLAHLKRRYALPFTRIFDTSIAARFLGEPALGLDVILGKYLGLTLPPSRQRDDWSARPLSDPQLAYAAADVLHLFALAARLRDALTTASRLAWVEEECAALAALPIPERVVDPDAFMHARGARELPARGLLILRELWEAREQLALAADRPPFKVLSEELLVRLATAAPSDDDTLAQVSGITPRLAARWGTAILAAVARGRALPESALPRPERRPRPVVPGSVSRRVERLRLWRTAAAPRLGLDPGLLLPNRLIRAVAEAGPRDLEALGAVEGIRRWRVSELGAELLAAVAGA